MGWGYFIQIMQRNMLPESWTIDSVSNTVILNLWPQLGLPALSKAFIKWITPNFITFFDTVVKWVTMIIKWIIYSLNESGLFYSSIFFHLFQHSWVFFSWDGNFYKGNKKCSGRKHAPLTYVHHIQLRLYIEFSLYLHLASRSFRMNNI